MEKMMSNVIIRWFFIALAVALAGCGGDETDETPDGSADTDTDSDAGADASALCEDGVDVMQPSPDGGAEIPTGIEECADGSWHRYDAIACTESALDDCGSFGEAGCPPDQLPCDTGFSFNECITPCASDADCAADEACVCEMAYPNNFATRCVPADCRTDADCGGLECGISRSECRFVDRLTCRTAADECHGDANCPGNSYFCSYDEEIMHWQCFEVIDCE